MPLAFETDRLFLQPTSEEDAAFILELFNTPKWLQYIGDRNLRTEEDARAYIRNRMRTQLERLGYSNYTMIRKADRMPIGICGLYDRAGLEEVDLGFALLPAFERLGYAREASQRLLRAGFEEFGLPCVQAITVRENAASQKLLERLGFAFVREVRLPPDTERLLLYECRTFSEGDGER